MPQELRVVKCFKCHTYQTDIVKKAKKWSCKICGEKQSVMQEFCRGLGKDCRQTAQQLNEKRRKMDEKIQEISGNYLSDSIITSKVEPIDYDSNQFGISELPVNTSISKWNSCKEESDQNNEINPHEVLSESENRNITTPVKRKRNCFDENTNVSLNKAECGRQTRINSPFKFSSVATRQLKSIQDSSTVYQPFKRLDHNDFVATAENIINFAQTKPVKIDFLRSRSRKYNQIDTFEVKKENVEIDYINLLNYSPESPVLNYKHIIVKKKEESSHIQSISKRENDVEKTSEEKEEDNINDLENCLRDGDISDSDSLENEEFSNETTFEISLNRSDEYQTLISSQTVCKENQNQVFPMAALQYKPIGLDTEKTIHQNSSEKPLSKWVDSIEKSSDEEEASQDDFSNFELPNSLVNCSFAQQNEENLRRNIFENNDFCIEDIFD